MLAMGKVGRPIDFAAVLKYKTVNGQPLILFVDYQDLVPLLPDVPNSWWFPQTIDCIKYDTFGVFYIKNQMTNKYFLDFSSKHNI